MHSKNPSNTRDTMLQYYATQGVITDPGEYRYLYEGLSSNTSELVGVVQGFMIHIFHAHRHGEVLTEERKREVALRRVEDILRRAQELDERPIRYPREPGKRVVGNCRDFAVLFCSLMRHQGVPARARCGFATYFSTPGEYQSHGDHWVAEYWDSKEEQWVRVDPQLDAAQQEAFHIDFDPHDMPPGKFLPAGEAWQLCREGKLDPNRCGFFDPPSLRGIWFIRDDMLRDFMAFNKLEILPWDCNEFMKDRGKEITDADYVLLDKVAALTTAGGSSFLEVRSLYKSNSALCMPADWKP